jgi:hypothetical protein
MLINRLHKQASGEIELSNNQLRAIEVLLRKTLPDLSAIAHSGAVEMVKADELSDSALAHIATGSGTGIAEPSQSQNGSGEVH